MKRLIVFWLLIISVLFAQPAYADPGQPPPPLPILIGQTNPTDIYTCCGLGSIEYLNAGEKSLIQTSEFHWYYAVAPGCSGLDGSFRSILLEGMQVWHDEIGVNFVEDPNGYAITFNCGVGWNSLCPGAVGCLGRSWPWNDAIDFDGPTMLTYAFRTSQVAVVIHELGHALGTWNEQYNIASFSCNPGWHDFMNCGPDSRHYFESVEKERAKRTFYPPALAQLGAGFNGQHYVWACGFDTLHATRVSYLVDRHDGRGIVWAGVIRPVSDADRNGCIGTGEVEGLAYNASWSYYEKQESSLSWAKWYNEARVP